MPTPPKADLIKTCCANLSVEILGENMSGEVVISDPITNRILRMCQCLTISPIEYQEQAKIIAVEYLNSINCTDTVDMMLPTKIGKDSQILYCACHMKTTDQQIERMVDWIKNQPYEWCAKELADIEDSIVQFCIIECSLKDFLTAKELEIIK